MKQYNRVYASVDLDAIESNIINVFNNINKNNSTETKIMAVIKTDGYGHGAVPIAKSIEHMHCIIGFAVATAEEAISLRRNGIKKKILILGTIFENQYEELLKNDITLPVFQSDAAKKISAIAKKLNLIAYLHLKLDTAMSRLGILPDNNAIILVKEIIQLDNIELEGVFTHFSKADETDKQSSFMQLDKFNDFIKKCAEANIYFKYKHCSNSAASIDLNITHFDFVRLGISLYGLYPSDEVNKNNVHLKPALSLVSCIAYLKEIQPGTKVGYGGTFTAKRLTKVATVPVGYGDGYPRLLSNKGFVLINGYKANIIGRICMDQFMVDVTDLPKADVMDKVVLIGSSNNEHIFVEQLSDLCGRFNYEFVCDLGKRIPRVYIKSGKIVATKDYFDE